MMKWHSAPAVRQGQKRGTMTLYELALEYKQTAAILYRRIAELEQERREAGDVRRLQLDGRIRPLRSMYRDTRAVARHLEHYYEKYAPRRTGGLPADHRRRA